jgi:hypothetical protein
MIDFFVASLSAGTAQHSTARGTRLADVALEIHHVMQKSDDLQDASGVHAAYETMLSSAPPLGAAALGHPAIRI